jgi:polar amino acid transport system permease protein
MERIIQTIPDIINATGMTLSLTLLGIAIGMVLGLVLALGRISKNSFLRGLSWFYIWIFRGTPMLMQIFFFYFVLPKMLPMVVINEFNTAIIALGLNSAAYLAEIIRAAIQSIDKGQLEAAKALGMPSALAMRRIIIPQSIRRMLPPVGNEFIMLIKDTSLVSAIGLTELLKVARYMTSGTGDAIFYLPIAGVYLLLTTVFTFVFEKLEKKYSIYE